MTVRKERGSEGTGIYGPVLESQTSRMQYVVDTLSKLQDELSTVVHACHPNTWEADPGGGVFMGWAIQQDLSQTY